MLLTDADQLREARAFSAELESNVRRLVRERDEARKYAEERNDEANRLQRLLNMTAQERDEARAALAGAENSLTAEREHSARLSRECQERHEELWAKVERLRATLKAWLDADDVSGIVRDAAERQREWCARAVLMQWGAPEVAVSLTDREALAAGVRDTPLVTEGDK